MNVFTKGDRVYVTDPALAHLRRIMRDATGKEPEPNHHGTVDEVDGGVVFIIFDGPDGEATSNCAPYEQDEVRLLGPWLDPYRSEQ